MDEKRWKEYEEKKKNIIQTSKTEKRKIWLIWLAFNIIADVALFVWQHFTPNLYPLILTVFLVTTFLSLYIALKEFVQQHKREKEQLNLLEQEEPFERFKTY